MNVAADNGTTVLCWPGRLLSEEDLRRYWTSQGEVVLGPGTVVTPLAWDWLKARRVRVRRDASPNGTPTAVLQGTWAYAEESPSALVTAVIQALGREGRALPRIEIARGKDWIRGLAESVARCTPGGLCLFCQEPGLVVCVANKVSGVRAVNVALPAQVDGMRKTLGPNFYAITPAGRTYFELRQLVKKATDAAPQCAPELAAILGGLDGHAHR